MDWIAGIAIIVVLIGVMFIIIMVRDAWKHEAEEDRKKIEEYFANMSEEELRNFDITSL